MNRREFLLTSAGIAAGAASCQSFRPEGTSSQISGAFAGPSVQIGHLLRDGGIPAPDRERRATVVIVGGGIAGLSTGWKFQRAGFHDFELLELEPEVGGNAISGVNDYTPYPWGAHYVPQPTPESKSVIELFEDLGVIEGRSPSGAPIYQERMLCFDPQERLFLHGRWQQDLLPTVGVAQRELDQYQHFHEVIDRYAAYRDEEGRKAFAIPMERSSRDPDLLALDRLSMLDFLLQNGLDSPSLHWYVDYACRDDYGCRSADVSAWAGIHYFASRPGHNREDAPVLTWPEGNGWIVKQLRKRLEARITTNALVYGLKPHRSGVMVDVYYPREGRSERLMAQDVVCACPTHLVPYLIPDMPSSRKDTLRSFEYAPWMVANLTLKGFPKEPPGGTPLCWDNVIYDSDSLGYVVATHQSLRTQLDGTVFTCYYPLTGQDPVKERHRLLETGWSAWVEVILKDLSRPHPDSPGLIQHIDLYRWGHAMVRPRPGFVWGEARRLAAEACGRITFAHSSLSGFSLFEEAQYRGVYAAERLLTQYQIPFVSSI